mgnify:CR=1 FL=1
MDSPPAPSLKREGGKLSQDKLGGELTEVRS